MNAKSNPKPLYQYINRRRAVQYNISTLIHNGETISDPKSIANAFKDTYASAFSNLIPGVLPIFPTRTDTLCPLPIISTEDIAFRLSHLNASKSLGPDGIHPFVLKRCSNAIAPHLQYIFNASINQGKLPLPWQQIHVKPLYKSGSKTKTTNYRPVTLNSIICKVLESIVQTTITNDLNQNQLLNPCQHGFRSRHTTVTNLLEFIDFITHSLNKHHTAHVIYLDFVKAFDKVPYQLLLLKLKAYGITGKLLDWCESFLTGRHQSVLIGNTNSDWFPVKSGVIQGSVLGRTFYLMYINDLLDGLTTKGFLYADDTNIGSSRPNSVSDTTPTDPSLQSGLDYIYQWSTQWGTPINLSKCFAMVFDRRPITTEPQYHINNVPIPICDHIKNLGVHITNDLSWNYHILQVTAMAYRLIRQLQRSIPSPPIPIIKQLYITIVRPTIEYAHPIIYPSKTALAQLEKVQRKCTKWGILKHLPYHERLKILQLPTIEQRRRRGDSIQMFKYFKGDHEINWINKPTHPTRITRQHHLKYSAETSSKNQYTQRHEFLPNRIASHWNSIPQDAIDSATIDSFKNAYDKHFHPDLLPQQRKHEHAKL
jgi:hypothetical protein